jgi:eukaryotic-like serine/threonine-protein kinase
MPLSPGTRLGPYEILGALGAGGMGEVYRAHDSRLNRHVAIKLLPATTATDAAARARLRGEALAAAALDHPFICKVFEIGEHDDALFLAMEYVAGETLDARLQRGPVAPAAAVRLALEMAEALETAHARGFLHRDLKPANIMLTAAADSAHVKIMDFGLARQVEAPAASDAVTVERSSGRLTAEGTIVGTPDYMSPEQMKGQPLDARSDLFSFGVILAELFGGRHPFRKATTVETCSAVLREPPDLGRGVSDELGVLLRRLLAKDVPDRPRSMAEVRGVLERLPATSSSAAAPAAVAPAPRRFRLWLAAGGAAIVVIAAAVGLRLGRREAPSEATAAPPAMRSIAVLPLDNYSGDAAQDYFAEGMTDELTADLATISQLRVISRGSAMQFQGARRPPAPEIARLLNVDALVEGSVVRSGDRVRITAQLIDARADRHLWAHTFEKSSRDVLTLQGEMASAIAREINVQLTPGEQKRLTADRAINPEAHDAYLKGRYFFNRPSDENLKKAIEHFEDAVRLQPDFAPAHSGLSDAYLWAGYNEGFLTASEARPKAKAAAERAIQLDDQSAEAHASLGTFKVFYEYDWRASEVEFRRAFALNPNYAFAHDQFGLGLAFQGRLDEAIAEGKQAAELDPLSPQIPLDNAIAQMFKGDFEAARALGRRSAELDPTYFFPPYELGWIEIEARQPAQAIPFIQKARTMGAPAFVTAWLAYAYGASGDRAKALATLEETKKESLRGQATAFNLAVVSIGLGDTRQALDHLERAYAEDSQWLGWLKMDRMFDPLRAEPRFAALLKKLRLDTGQSR